MISLPSGLMAAICSKSMLKYAIHHLPIVSTLMLLGACSSMQPTRPPVKPTNPAAEKPKPPYSWDAEAAKTTQGAAHILVSLSEQHAYFYKGDILVGDTKCSTGKAGFATPAGEYKITQKDRNHRSNLYGKFVGEDGAVLNSNVDMSKMKVPEGATFDGASMPFYQRFTGGYGLHAGIVPNRPASHGCVRLPRVMAERFFGHTQIGDAVTVAE